MSVEFLARTSRRNIKENDRICRGIIKALKVYYKSYDFKEINFSDYLKNSVQH